MGSEARGAVPGGVDLERDILERITRGIILRTGAYISNDHFVLSSGRHAGEYVDKTLVTTEPAFTEGLGHEIARQFAAERLDVVLATGYGALILAHCVARAHPSMPKLIYALKRRDPAGRATLSLPREFERFVSSGTQAIIVEDMISTGETIRELTRLIEARGGRVLGAGALWQRNVHVRFAFPCFTLIRRDLPTYPPDDCPLCRRGVPVNAEYGHGATLAERPAKRRARRASSEG